MGLWSEEIVRRRGWERIYLWDEKIVRWEDCNGRGCEVTGSWSDGVVRWWNCLVMRLWGDKVVRLEDFEVMRNDVAIITWGDSTYCFVFSFLFRGKVVLRFFSTPTTDSQVIISLILKCVQASRAVASHVNFLSKHLSLIVPIYLFIYLLNYLIIRLSR